MSRILIIGSEGQLGSELSSFLKKKSDLDNIILADIKDNSSSNLTYKKLDALNFNDLESLVIDNNIDEVYHLAAILSAKGEEDPMLTWDLNMNSLFNVLDLAKNRIIKKVFWPSSISVFGKNTPKVNTNQFSIKEPNTVYGISKLSGERWCEYYNVKYGTDIRSVRFPGIISSNTLPGGGTTDYAVDIFHSFLKDENYNCFLNENTMLPMIYIDDAIESIYKIMNVKKENLSIKSSYNLSGFSMTPKMIEIELKKFKENFSVTYQPDNRQEIADSWPNSIDDIDAQNDWDWISNYDIANTAKEMIRRLKNNKR
ncbi:MAG: NAD-dependent epimerase/dehydratase family protein [Cytophagales bacterium]